MNLRSSIFFILALLLLNSCDKKRVFDEYKTVGNNWKKSDIVSFSFKESDTTKAYNLFINLRNNDNYEFNNLYLIVALEQPDGLVKRDTLQYEMTNPDGTLLGNGFSDIKENKLFYKEKMRFNKLGTYKVHIQHAVRQTGKVVGVEALEGVTEVGFRIESLE